MSVRRADEPPGRLLELDDRLGQRVAAPRHAALSQLALLGERVGGPAERQLGHHDAAQRVALRVEALPEGLEREERQALVGEELVAQPLGATCPRSWHSSVSPRVRSRGSRTAWSRSMSRRFVNSVSTLPPIADVHALEQRLEVAR